VHDWQHHVLAESELECFQMDAQIKQEQDAAKLFGFPSFIGTYCCSGFSQ